MLKGAVKVMFVDLNRTFLYLLVINFFFVEEALNT
jgi:hypothetical protein